MIWCSDFETINDENDCRVWAWKSITLDEKEEARGIDIESFMEWISQRKRGDVVYFHNLRFDGEFIVYYLLKHGWPLMYGESKLQKNSFKTVISDMGQWYSIQLMLHNGNRITIKDSLKIWNFSIKELAGAMGMDISKGEIDYNAPRKKGYQPTDDEWDYIDRDVRIACRAMKFMIDDGYTKLTAGANALWSYKMIVGQKWDYWFPELPIDVDAAIRKSYRGGWCYANPKFKGKEVGEGIVLDVNSLYPSRMYYDLLPYGTPVYFEGRFRENENYPLCVQRILVDLKLKPNYLPTIQLKHSMRFANTEYITATNGDPIEITLTSVDLKLLFDHYDIISIEYIDGYAFHGCYGMFTDYVNHWMTIKEQASRDGNKPRRNQAKLFMNSLYGKFAKRPEGQSKYPYLGDDDRLHLELGEIEDRGSLYIPVGTFITAYARAYTIRSAQKNYDRFLYADTDSLHLVGTEVPADIEVHDTKLGAWKLEGEFARARYLGAKCYAEAMHVSRETLDRYLEENPGCECHVDYENLTLLSLVCAGMPASSKGSVRFEDFNVGLTVGNKLVPKHVPGGIVLKETTFEVKSR